MASLGFGHTGRQSGRAQHGAGDYAGQEAAVRGAADAVRGRPVETRCGCHPDSPILGTVPLAV